MTPEMIITVGRNAIMTMLLVAAPMLISGLVIGLMISIFQAITQIHEMTLTFIPKIVVVAVALLIFLPWMINNLLDFTRGLFGVIPSL
ncbi:MAG TPA: flagellar biosynthesis protein FliQ [candidate division Zixibacteria bacterium]|nr:flagellar biosynthesis protein FliQ [candidate division Zixibacteria bacterium]